MVQWMKKPWVLIGFSEEETTMIEQAVSDAKMEFGSSILAHYIRESRNPKSDKVVLLVCKDNQTCFQVGEWFFKKTGKGYITSDRKSWRG